MALEAYFFTIARLLCSLPYFRVAFCREKQNFFENKQFAAVNHCLAKTKIKIVSVNILVFFKRMGVLFTGSFQMFVYIYS